MAPLPQGIIMQILLLLPLESLLACKCVSKQWKNLVDSPHFVGLYGNFGSTVFYLYQENLYCLFINENDDNNERKKKMRPRRIPIGRLKRYHNLLLESSSRNKRVCVKAANDEFLVYDLLTGKSYKVIPPPRSQDELCRCLAFGFGYDPYSDDYKIVMLVSIRDQGQGPDYFDNKECNMVFVYSFKDGGWASLQGFPNAYYNSQWSDLAAYCFNGVLHWVVDEDYDFEIHTPQVMAAFDLQSGSLAEMALPDKVGYKRHPCPTLAELNGDLCCCSYVQGWVEYNGRFDVYVMKEYGVRESWTMLLKIDKDPCLRLRNKWSWENWGTAPGIYPRDGGGERVAISLCRKSKLRVLEYDLCKGETRVLHERTREERMVPRFKKRFKEAMRSMLTMLLFVCILCLSMLMLLFVCIFLGLFQES